MNSGMNSPLPEGFMSIEDIQSLPNQQIRDGRLVNLIGFVKDYQPPIQTRGSGTLPIRVTRIMRTILIMI